MFKKMLSAVLVSTMLLSSQAGFASQSVLIGETREVYTHQVLTDEILSSLTRDDISSCAEELELFVHANPDANFEAINTAAVKILTQVYNDKLYQNVEGNGLFSTHSYLPKQYTDLNSAEKALVKKYPGAAIRVYEASKEALSESIRRFTKSTLIDGNGDAFRHAYWNALMTKKLSFTGRYVSVAHGSNLAEQFATAHETERTSLAAKMDLANNASGRKIAENSFGNMWGSFPSDSKLANQIFDEVKKGKLIRIVNNRLVSTNNSL